jgi:hypothetical protein
MLRVNELSATAFPTLFEQETVTCLIEAGDAETRLGTASPRMGGVLLLLLLLSPNPDEEEPIEDHEDWATRSLNELALIA